MNRERPGHVLLLHGIWMVGSTLHLLARRLRAAGWSVERFAYPNVTGGPARAVPELRARLLACAPLHPVVHLVGHSLGGMVAVAACADATDLPPGRIVCLGSPLAGSAVAQRLRDLRVGSLALGRSTALLCAGFAEAPPARPVGAIAGTRAIGAGRLLCRFAGPNDGTVAVAETRVPWLADHCCVAATHTGLLVDRSAAAAVIDFLRSGRFAAAARG